MERHAGEVDAELRGGRDDFPRLDRAGAEFSGKRPLARPTPGDPRATAKHGVAPVIRFLSKHLVRMV